MGENQHRMHVSSLNDKMYVRTCMWSLGRNTLHLPDPLAPCSLIALTRLASLFPPTNAPWYKAHRKSKVSPDSQLPVTRLFHLTLAQQQEVCVSEVQEMTSSSV